MALATAPVEVSDLPALAQSFRRSLRARNCSPRTIEGYLDGVETFITYLRREQLPMIASNVGRADIEAFVGDQVEHHKPNTAATRYRALQAFFKWLAEEHEIVASPMVGLRPPMVPEAPPPILSDDEIRAMLRACDGVDFFSRRDAAVIRLFADTGLRCAELAGLRVEDIDLETNVAVVLNAKMRRPRVVSFGFKTSAAIDRYMRVRATHAEAGRVALWLGHKGALTTNAAQRGHSPRSHRAPALTHGQPP